MAPNSPDPDAQRITVSLPKPLLTKLNQFISRDQRSQFIAEAIEARLALEDQVVVLEETAGAWSNENHPDMLTGNEIDRWLENLHHSWNQLGALK